MSLKAGKRLVAAAAALNTALPIGSECYSDRKRFALSRSHGVGT
jgi:hypothetical protein